MYRTVIQFLPLIITVAVSLIAALQIKSIFVRLFNKKIESCSRFSDTRTQHDLTDTRNREVNRKSNRKPLDLLSVYRDLLGLGSRYTEEKLKIAYRNTAAMYHPDRYVGAARKEREKAEEQMKKVNEAYEYLKAGVI